MSTLDAVGSVLDEDRMAFKDPFDILGVFLGDMSGPISAESREERRKRLVILPQPASTIRIDL
jgi:hypothetical protein